MSEAREAIRRLLLEYGERIDRGDFESVGALFAHGALLDARGRELARGADAVAGFYRAIVVLHDGSPQTVHTTVNAVIDVDGEEAAARSIFVVYQSGAPIIVGRYADRFRVVDGEWCFVERAFTVEQTGDLSRHLRGGGQLPV